MQMTPLALRISTILPVFPPILTPSSVIEGGRRFGQRAGLAGTAALHPPGNRFPEKGARRRVHRRE